MQFGAVPWLRDHLVDQIRGAARSASTPDPEQLARPAASSWRRGLPEALRSGGGRRAGRAVRRRPEQRAQLDRVTAVMSLLEGHADVVMDDVGPAGRPDRSARSGRSSSGAAAAPAASTGCCAGCSASRPRCASTATAPCFVRARRRPGRHRRASTRVWASPGDPAARRRRSRDPRRLGRGACTADDRSAAAAVAATRRRRSAPALADAAAPATLVLVACSGGADSLALAAATAFEAPRAGLRAGAVVVDHGLQAGSADGRRARPPPAAPTSASTRSRSLTVDGAAAAAGPEAAARAARYAALDDAADRLGAAAVLLGHTRDDQAETVLLGLARGSGRPVAGRDAAPRAAASRARCSACAATTHRGGVRARAGLDPWEDPHNADPAYRRVRVRRGCCPCSRRDLGPGRRRGARPHRRPAARRTPTPLDALGRATARRRRWARRAAGRRRARRAARGAVRAPGAGGGRARGGRARRRAVAPATSPRSTRWSTAWRGQGAGATCPGGVQAQRERVGRLLIGTRASGSIGCPRPARPAPETGASRGRRPTWEPTSRRCSSPRSRSAPGSPSWPPRSTRTTRARTCCSSACSRARSWSWPTSRRALPVHRRRWTGWRSPPTARAPSPRGVVRILKDLDTRHHRPARARSSRTSSTRG